MRPNKLTAVLLCLVMLICCAAPSYADDIQSSLISGIISFNHPSGDIQAWIDGPLTENAGISSEWYILALSQYGEYDFSSYEKALLSYLSENTVASASSRQKYALCLASVGSTDKYISSVMNDSIGKQGVLSFTYGLHLLNNGYKSQEHTTDSIIEKLLSLQLSDGGFALSGNDSASDVTAMTLQALAPHYEAKSEVKSAVDRALDFLSNKQGDNGDYLSYGVYNPESTAQVLVALSSLGIDFENDARFIKNGNTLLDAIGQYRLSNGSFCHTLGGDTNKTSTAQVFYSMVAYLRMKDGSSPLYILDRAEPENAEPAPTAPDDTEKPEEKSLDYKPWAILVIVSIGAAAAIVLLLKKRNYKSFIALLLAVSVGIIFILATDFRSAEDYYNGNDVSKENVIGKVTLTVRCDAIVGKSASEHIPSDGAILDVTEFELAEGESAYDILIEAARKYNIQIENNGSSDMAYIVGINYIYEFDFGDLSGWAYRINGKAPSVGCGEYTLTDGDFIEFIYTLNLGRD